jgi:hypothetical protein
MVFSRTVFALTALFMLPFCSFATATEGVLERAGALTCLATDADTNDRQIEARRLECDLEPFANDQTAKLEGTLYGKGLYLVDPGGSKAIWSILTPKRQIGPKMLEGDYDVISSFGLAESRCGLPAHQATCSNAQHKPF